MVLSGCGSIFSAWLDRQLLTELPTHWRLSYMCFAIASFLAIGSHWMINPVKTTVFFHSAGAINEPIARSYVPVVLLPVIFLYNLLISCVGKARIIVSIVCSVYGSLYLFIGFTLLAAEGQPEAWIGWLIFFVTESKASVINTLLWTVINDVSDPSYVKQAYPVLSFVTQIGAILGSVCTVHVAHLGGIVGLLFGQAICLFSVIFAVWFACRFASTGPLESPDLATVVEIASFERQENSSATPEDSSIASESASFSEPSQCRRIFRWVCEQAGGFTIGIWQIATKPYVAMTFWVSCAHLAIRGVIDYQGQVLIKNTFVDDKEAQVAYGGKALLLCSITTALLTSVGTRAIVETCGLRLSLVALPLTMLGAMATLVSYYRLWIGVAITVVVNAVTYGLNGPCREMLYVRTSREIKYRAKAWADMYGGYLQKTIAAQINLHINREMPECKPNCFNGPFSFGFTAVWTSIWVVIALTVGRIHAQLETSGQKIE